MKTKQLGNSDLFITPVGLGAWAIGGSGWEFAWGGQDDNDSIAAIHEALDAGVLRKGGGLKYFTKPACEVLRTCGLLTP